MNKKIYTVLIVESAYLDIKIYSFFDKEKAKKKYNELLSDFIEEGDIEEEEIKDYLKFIESEMQD